MAADEQVYAGDDVLLSSRLVYASEVRARARQGLRQVPILLPSLCHVSQGHKVLVCGEQVYRADASSLLLFPAGIMPDVDNMPGPGGYQADMVSFSPKLLQRFRLHYGELISEHVSGLPVNNGLCVALDEHTAMAWQQLLACLNRQAPPSVQAHHVEGVLLALCLAGHGAPLLFNRDDPLHLRIQQMMLLSPGYDWTVADVAARLGLGESTLRRRLTQEQHGFREILESVRLGCALQWLQTSQQSVTVIAGLCGYESASRFAVRFRQHYGLSPSELRQTL